MMIEMQEWNSKTIDAIDVDRAKKKHTQQGDERSD